eukprot:SAG31_NODE_42624_length_270_cov_1.485380_1_plen_26_part_10
MAQRLPRPGQIGRVPSHRPHFADLRA